VNPTERPERRIGIGPRLSTAEGGTGSQANSAVRFWLEFGLHFTWFRASATPGTYRGGLARGKGHRRGRSAEEADPCGQSPSGMVFCSRGRLTSLDFHLKSKRRVGQRSPGYESGRAAVREMPASRSGGGAYGVLADSSL
jgi:hypothetical protein